MVANLSSKPGRSVKKAKSSTKQVGSSGKSRNSVARSATSAVSGDLHEAIACRAYARYQERGYRHGYDLEDWLVAEQEILSRQLSGC
ncbi:DUF2934 domain-containing protein [Petrachloros mirabilis]